VKLQIWFVLILLSALVVENSEARSGHRRPFRPGRHHGMRGHKQADPITRGYLCDTGISPAGTQTNDQIATEVSKQIGEQFGKWALRGSYYVWLEPRTIATQIGERTMIQGKATLSDPWIVEETQAIEDGQLVSKVAVCRFVSIVPAN
jgi:hypothetical protein